MVNKTIRDPKTGWLQYFGLRFRVTPKGYAEKYVEEGISFEFLGYDTDPDFTAPGAFEGDKPTDLAIMWWRYKEGGKAGYLENYFDKDEKKVDEPVSEEQSEELNIKNFRFGSYMQRFNRDTIFLLENLVKDYKLGIDVKPNIRPSFTSNGELEKEYIKIDLYLSGKKIDELLVKRLDKDEIVDYAKNYPDKNLVAFVSPDFQSEFKQAIFESIDSKLSTEGKRNIRKRKYNSLMINYSDMFEKLSDEDKIISVQYFKKIADQILNAELRLVNSNYADLYKFDHDLDKLKQCALENPNLFKDEANTVFGRYKRLLRRAE